MTDYFMQHKMLTFKHRFSIDDANGAPVYYVETKPVALVQQAKMTDLAGREVALVKEKPLKLFGSAFNVYFAGRLAMTVTQNIKLRRTIDLTGTDWSVQGTWPPGIYDVLDPVGQVQAHVATGLANMTDVYSIQTAPGAPDAQVLALVVAIDAILSPPMTLTLSDWIKNWS